MKGLYYLLFCWVLIQANAQTQISGYEYWFNNNYQARVQETIVPAVQFNLNLNAPTPGLPAGIHLFNIRFWDNQGYFGSPVGQFFFKTPETGIVDRQIVEYQYWINNDYSNSVTIPVQPQNQLGLDRFIDLSALISGFHTINLRFKDNSGLWSAPVSQFFYVSPLPASQNREIIAYQYWIDNDFGNAVRVTTPTQQVFLLEGLVGLQGLEAGIRSFNIRFMDNSNLWSAPVSQFFYVSPIPATENREIVAYQYWIDNDFGNAVTVNATGQQFFILDQLLPLHQISIGLHTFNIRFRDNSGMWSSSLSQIFYKIPQFEGGGSNLITAYRYWLNNNFENHNLVELGTPLADLGVILDLDMTEIRKGNYSIHFQFRDLGGLWSQVTTDNFTKNPLPIARFEHAITVGCDSTSVAFSNRSIDADNYLWNFGDGSNSTEAEPTHVYLESNQYDVSLTITDTPSGASSTLTKNVNINIQTADNSVVQDGFTITANAQDATYQWLDCNNRFAPIAGQTNRWLLVTANGSYAVEVTQNGCTKVSDCIVVANVGVEQIVEGLEVKIFPNPTNGLVNVDLGKQVRNLKITITDSSGKVVGEHKFDSGQQVSFVLDAPPGFYLLNMISSDQLATKVVIRL